MNFYQRLGMGGGNGVQRDMEELGVIEVFYILTVVYTFAKTHQIIQVKRMNFMLVDYTE